MDAKQPVTVHITRHFDSPPQRVFDAWLDSKTAGTWLFTTAGRPVCVEIDARAGGWFYIAQRWNGRNVEHVGEYLEVVRPHRLVFTLLAEQYSLNFERVTVRFDAHANGCRLSLNHQTGPQSARQVRRDWNNFLDGLAAMLGESVRGAPALEMAGCKATASHC